MSRPKDNVGRIAIEWLKAEYLDGNAFADSYAIRDALAAEHDRLRKCTPAEAAAWDRAARYELVEDEDDPTYVTQPVYVAGYQRNPRASVDVRGLTQDVRLRELVKRTRHQYKIANAVAIQPDATRAEVRRAAEIGVALGSLERALLSS